MKFPDVATTARRVLGAASVHSVAMEDAWALDQLSTFARAAVPLSTVYSSVGVVATYSMQRNDAIAQRAVVIERMLDRALPDWR